jgi:hypothetical protein
MPRGRKRACAKAAGVVCALMVAAAAGLVLRAADLPARDAEISALVADTDLVPPEFAADALIRLSGSSRITDASWRLELLDQAFQRTYGAQDQYRRSSPPGIPPDSRQGAELFASTTALNRLSLQVRIAQVMALTDPRRGREIFEWIDLNLAPGVCEDPLVPSVDDYYTALSFLARTSFGSDRGEALRFLQLYLWRAHLPSEMPAVARALQRFRPSAFEATYLEGVLQNILKSGTTDPRGFSAADLDIVTRIAALQKAYRDIGVLNFHLLDTLREYLVAQLKGPRCSDSVTESMTPAAYNAAVVRLGAGKLVDLMDPNGVRPSKMLGIARIDMYWQTPEARRLHEDALDLRGRGQNPLPIRIRQTQEWRERAERLIVDLVQWTGHHEATERDYFFQKSFLFGGLIELMPQSRVRTSALRSFVEFMRNSDVDRDRRPLWFAFLTRLLEMARGAERREILAALENSHHPVLSLYARMERIAPTSGTR